MSAAHDARRVALITGASRGIGAGLVAGYRRAGYAVVGVAPSMPPSDDPDVLSIQGDIQFYGIALTDRYAAGEWTEWCSV